MRQSDVTLVIKFDSLFYSLLWCLVFGVLTRQFDCVFALGSLMCQFDCVILLLVCSCVSLIALHYSNLKKQDNPAQSICLLSVYLTSSPWNIVSTSLALALNMSFELNIQLGNCTSLNQKQVNYFGYVRCLDRFYKATGLRWCNVLGNRSHDLLR